MQHPHRYLPYLAGILLLYLLTGGMALAGQVDTGSITEDPAAASTLGPEHIGVIVNDNDPLSQAIAAYYMEKRGIPPENLIHVQLTAGRSVLNPDKFRLVLDKVEAQTPAGVQVYALAWTLPYRVGCMSITTV